MVLSFLMSSLVTRIAKSVYFSSDEANNACSTVDLEEWRRPRSESSTGADNESVYMHGGVYSEHHRRKRMMVSLTSNCCTKLLTLRSGLC